MARPPSVRRIIGSLLHAHVDAPFQAEEAEIIAGRAVAYSSGPNDALGYPHPCLAPMVGNQQNKFITRLVTLDMSLEGGNKPNRKIEFDERTVDIAALPESIGQENREAAERERRLTRFIRKAMFLGGGYRLLTSVYFDGHRQLARDVAEFFQPEIDDLCAKLKNGKARSLNLSSTSKSEILGRASKIDQLLHEAGLNQNDKDQVVMSAMEVVNSSPLMTHSQIPP